LIAPNEESALNEEAAKLLLSRYEDFVERAKMLTELHALKKTEFKSSDSSQQSEPSGKKTEADKKLEKAKMERKKNLKRL